MRKHKKVSNMILKKVHFPSTSQFFKLSQEKPLIAILHNKKRVSSFNFSLVFSVKLSYYKNFQMT